MYQALYRKYRPMDFDSVVGQDSIIKTLKNSIINHNFSHAYMFFGPRGTGKTTVSKIFARNINCLSPIDGIACHNCSSCKVSFSKDCVDIIEIDAASNNGVDEIRDLKNKISLVPSELKYKVYIIDEVHMLSIGAFNALLKTLEEPPEHAIFILATTDPQKVPETIISRCQCFSFKRISSDSIEKRLKYVCGKEKIEIDDEVLKNISILSDGGLRDALGALDKLISFTNNKITMNDFEEVNGVISKNDLKSFVDKILLGKISELLLDIENFNSNGKNLIQIIVQILDYTRNLLVDYYLNNLSINYSIDLLQDFANLINEKMFDIKRSSNAKIYIEMLLLKFINDKVIFDSNKIFIDKSFKNEISDIIPKSAVLEKKKNSVVKNEVNDLKEVEYNVINNNDIKENLNDDSKNIIESPKILNIDEIMRIRVNNTLAEANKSLLKLEYNNFELLKDYTFDQEIGFIVCSLLDAKLRAVSSSCIIISFEFDSNVEQNLLILDKLTKVYNNITNTNKKIAIISDKKWEEVKNDYINNLKNGIKYEILEEPEVIFEDLNKNDIISNNAIELFGDIVEFN